MTLISRRDTSPKDAKVQKEIDSKAEKPWGVGMNSKGRITI